MEIEGFDLLLSHICETLTDAKRQIANSVNSTIVKAYWNVGKYLVEYEQQGEQRAAYGKSVVNELSKRLTDTFGSGFTTTNLRYMRQFYVCFPIYHTLCDKLSWSHCRSILKVNNEEARIFYLKEAVAENWSVRQLERQVNTCFYERLLSSKDKKNVSEEIAYKVETFEPRQLIRDPYILEFLGLPQGDAFLESDLEQLLISKIQKFLLEMGRGFSFVARQKRISFEDKHFYIDLVFYNYLARCFVLVDLKIDELTHQDIGQMQMYVNYYTRELMNEGDNPPIGLILCAEKNDMVVKYTLSEDNTQIFAAKYMTYMPTQEELKQLIDDK